MALSSVAALRVISSMRCSKVLLSCRRCRRPSLLLQTRRTLAAAAASFSSSATGSGGSSGNNNNNNNNNNDPSSSSSLFRLPRPHRGGGGGGNYIDPFPAETARAHAVTLFPGDFSDDGDGDNSVWDDDDENEEDDDDDVDETAAFRKQLRIQAEKERLQKERWIRNSQPPVRTPVINNGRARGRGGRKTASAVVWIQPGLGHVVVNHKPLEEYFPRLSDRELILQPVVATETAGDVWDVSCTVQGGGLTGQAGAVRHGLARALNAWNPALYRPPLKKLGLLERDYRKVERKKIGHKKARKSPQWVRR